MKFLASLAFFFMFSINAHAGFLDKIFGYKSFEDCILGELKGNESNAAAQLKNRACRKKFPEKKTTTTYTRVGNLKVKNDFWYDEAQTNPQLRFTVENQTRETITKQVVKICAGSCGEDQDFLAVSNFDFKLKPNQSVQLYLFPYNYVPRGKFRWKVEGYKSN